MKRLLVILISLLITINPCLIGRGLLRRRIQTEAPSTQNGTDQINKSLQEGFNRTKEIATFLLAEGKNIAGSTQQAVTSGIGTLKNFVVSAKNQFNTSQKVLKSNMKSGLSWTASLAQQAVTTGIQGARDLSRATKNRLTHLPHNLKSGIQAGAGYTKEIAAGTGSFLVDQGKNIASLAQKAVSTGMGVLKDSCIATKNCLGKLHTEWTPTIKVALNQTKEIATDTGSFLVAQGKNVASLAGQAVGIGAGALKDSFVLTKQAVVTGAEGARDFSVVAKNGLTYCMHNLKSGIQAGAGYTKEIATDTGSFPPAKRKDPVSAAISFV